MLYSNCKTPSTYECLMLIASKFTIISLVEHAVYLTIITHFIQMSSCNFDPINDCNLWFQRTISSYSFDTSSYWAKYQISVNLWLFMTLLFLVALVRYFNSCLCQLSTKILLLCISVRVLASDLCKEWS